MRLTTVASLILAAAALGARPAASQEQGSDFHWKGRLAPGKRLEIKGVNGDIRALAAGGAEAEVNAIKRAHRSDPEEVEIRVVEHAEGVTICAVYPTPRRARRENTCEPGDHWSSSTEDNDVKVHFTVNVPAGVEFNGQTVNGDVDAQSLRGDTRLSTVNGSVQVSTTGLAEARTVNGSVVVTMGRSDWTGDLEFSTVNGGITLNLPADLNTEVRATTVNGDLQTDYPLTVTGRFGPRHMNGTIGKGGRTLHLETVNGGIRLRKNT